MPHAVCFFVFSDLDCSSILRKSSRPAEKTENCFRQVFQPFYREELNKTRNECSKQLTPVCLLSA